MKTRYRARKNPWPFAVLCLLTAAAGAALGYAAFYLRFSPLYLVSFSAFMFAAQMFSVFVLPAYDYELDGPFLRIYRTAGRSSLCVFDVDLSLASAILPYAEYKAGRKKRRGGKKARMSLRRTQKTRVRADVRRPHADLRAGSGLRGGCRQDHHLRALTERSCPRVNLAYGSRVRAFMILPRKRTRPPDRSTSVTATPNRSFSGE